MDSFADTQPMGAPISLEADFAVKAGAIDALQDLRALILLHAKAGAPAADAALGFAFDAQLSPDLQTLRIRTGASTEEPLRQLLLRIGPDLAQLEARAQLTRVHCAGAVSQALQHTLTRFNSTFA